MCLTWVNLTPSPPGAVRPCLNTSLLLFQAWLLSIYCKSYKQFSQKIFFKILRVQKNARHMYLLFTAFWHQHSKFQWAQKGAWAALYTARRIRSQTWPAPWITMQCLTSTAGQTSASCLLLKTSPTKAISLMRTCALEAVGLCKSTTFSSPCPKASPIMGWFWDYVYQTACGYIHSYV